MEPTIYKPSIYKGAGIYKTGAEGGGGGLPDTYQELLYLRNKANAWVKIPADIYGWGVEMVFALNSYSSGNNIYEFFSHRGDSNDILSIINGSNELAINNHTYTTTYTLSYLSNFEQVKIDIKQNNSSTITGKINYGSNEINVNGTSNGRTTGTYITIFRGSDNPFGKSKRLDIYYLKVYDTNQELCLDLVPAKRTSDSVLGFYDKLTDNFYACESQGDLEAGPTI